MAQLDILARLQTRLLEIVGTGLPLITSSIRDADLIGLAHLRGEMVAALADVACDGYRAARGSPVPF